MSLFGTVVFGSECVGMMFHGYFEEGLFGVGIGGVTWDVEGAKGTWLFLNGGKLSRLLLVGFVDWLLCVIGI